MRSGELDLTISNTERVLLGLPLLARAVKQYPAATENGFDYEGMIGTISYWDSDMPSTDECHRHHKTSHHHLDIPNINPWCCCLEIEILP